MARTPDDNAVRYAKMLRGLEWRLFYRPIYRQRLGIFRRLTRLGSGRVLEVGCGSGLFLRELARAGYDVEGLDISAGDIAYARERLGLKAFQGSADDLSLEANRYDAVLLMSVLEHVPTPLDTVQRVLHALRPGGWIVLGRFGGVLRPSPRPDGVGVHLFRNLLRGERLQLDRLEPRGRRLQSFASAGTPRRLEAKEETELRGRDANPREVEDRVPKRLAQIAAAKDWALVVDEV